MWISEYIRSLDENEFRRLFLEALTRKGPDYVKLTHSPIEYGRDIIAVFNDELNLYQLKTGNIDTKMWEKVVEPQVRKMFSVPIDDVRVDEKQLNKKGFIVFTGVINIYVDKPIKYLTEFYKEQFTWDIVFWDITSVCNFFVENKLENLLICKTIWYELQTLLSKLEAVELELEEFFAFTNKLIEKCTLVSYKSFRKWFIDYVINEIKTCINNAEDDNAKISYKFFEVCFLEFAITRLNLNYKEYYDEYFKLGDALNLIVLDYKFFGATWSDFKEVRRNFALTLLVISTSIHYIQKNKKDTSQLFVELTRTVEASFSNLWFYVGNIGRNFNSNIEELETITWFSLPILLLKKNGGSDLSELWLRRIGQYLRGATKVPMLDEYTSNINFIFLELIILINSSRVFNEFIDVLSYNPLIYYLDESEMAFNVDESFVITVEGYKKLWNKNYLNQFDNIQIQPLIEIISSFRGGNHNTTIDYILGHIRRVNCYER
ncbi:hypothetical protein [Paenibacillus massiliensis]|uniref:hypothetical protein n=1 Tax=Paenibacillus massiliensis TaxID=225917 RepID=UPI00040B9B5A|nr:hypothetical protein [Paenibacillus massiliensis]